MVSLPCLFLQLLTIVSSHSPWNLDPIKVHEIIQSDEVIFEFPGLVTLYSNGSVARADVGFLPASLDPLTGVSSKDTVIQPKTNLSARIYLPKVTDPQIKLPLVIYFHGGAFCVESAFSPTYHNYLNSLVKEADVVAISVEYSLAPEHHLPVAYEQSWSAIQWAISQSNGEEWLKKYVNFSRIFLAGDSAGGNIAHNMAIRLGVSGVKIEGIVLIDPLFNGVEPIGSEVVTLSHIRAAKLWRAVYPLTTGSDDPLINPEKDLNFHKLGCNSVLVCVAEEDQLRDRGIMYYEMLGKRGWNGVGEFMESPGENHVFHLTNTTSKNAKDLMKRVVSFLN